MAANLFDLLRWFDAQGTEVILAEGGVDMVGLGGLAVMNRLRKAAGYRIVKA